MTVLVRGVCAFGAGECCGGLELDVFLEVVAAFGRALAMPF
jgi:hypothetical protein